MAKHFTLCFVTLLALLVSSVAYSCILPAYQVSEKDKQLTAEEALATHEAELAELGQRVSLQKLTAHHANPKIRLTQKEKYAAFDLARIESAIGFWKRVSELKSSLVTLIGNSPSESALLEADNISRSIIETLYRVSNEWQVGSALFRNFLIKIGVRQKGFCYHYVGEILNDLPQKSWRYFDLHWGTAWKDGFKENNALVITAKGGAFEDGIAIDAWRTGGRPFWTAVKGDRFPWEEEDILENARK